MGKKNSQIHLMIETSSRQMLEKESKERCISLAELCRQRLRENDELFKIKQMLEEVLKKELQN